MPFQFSTPKPLKAAVEAVGSKTIVGAKIRTKEWQEDVARGLTEEAFMSAGVESARALQTLQDGIGSILNEVRDARHGGYAMDRGKLVAKAQQLANAEGLRNADPSKRGGLEDFGSERRLKLILEQQISSAQAKAFWEQGNDPDLLAAFPALRLVRVRSSKVKRDWETRWKEAAEKVGWVGVAQNGEMIALKSSPIWRALSRFDRPYPPFDFGSGMGVEEVDRETTDAIGLTKPGDAIGSAESAWKADLAASVKGLSPETLKQLKGYFGAQLIVGADGIATFKRGAKGSAAAEAAMSAAQAAAEPIPPRPNQAPNDPVTAQVDAFSELEALPSSAPAQPANAAPAPSAIQATSPEAIPPRPPAEIPDGATVVSKQIGTKRAPKRQRMQQVLEGADKVHTVPDSVAPYEVVMSITDDPTKQGEFAPEAKRIFIRPDAERPELTFAQELGHYVDYEALGGAKDYASKEASDMADLRQIIEATPAVKKLHEGMAYFADDPGMQETLAYFLQPKEQFARAYAQMLVTRLGGPLKEQLDDLRKEFGAGYWPDEEFAPVLQAMEDLFKKRGWLR